jgi:hypothetical protein
MKKEKDASPKFKAQKDYPDFCETVDRLSVEELDKRLLDYTKERQKVEDELKNKKEIIQKRDELKEMTGPYTDVQKALKVKMQYVLHLIGEKGGKT